MMQAFAYRHLVPAKELDVAVAGRYRLIFVVVNTLWAILTQRDQERCVRNVAEHRTDDGAFVVEAYVPDPARFDRGQRVSARAVGSGRASIEISTHDPATQRISSRHVFFEDGADPRLYPVEIRYVWPSELDLMARLAGLRLRERWGGWHGEPYTGEGQHVSALRARPIALPGLLQHSPQGPGTPAVSTSLSPLAARPSATET